ncbi:MAG: hypothetical protein HY391_02330, partial [Deltaproteobacteria bacterium]|nr:hypothetical protein [Deltaproteobacteria bacterium]
LAQLNYLRFIILFESLWKHSGKNLRQVIDVMRQNQDAAVPFLKSELHRLCRLEKGCQTGLQELEVPLH